MTETAGAATGLPPSRSAPSRPPLMRSPVRRLHSEAGATFEVRGTWEVPASYGEPARELLRFRSGLGVADITARGKVHLSGAVEPLVARLVPGGVEPQRIGAIGSGGHLARLGRDWALALTGPSAESGLIGELEAAASDGAMATDMTSGLAGFLVTGPGLGGLLERTLRLDQREVQPGRCLGAKWARISALLLVTELESKAVEIYVGAEYARYAWRTLIELGAVPAGWRTLDALGWK